MNKGEQKHLSLGLSEQMMLNWSNLGKEKVGY